ncbi:symmetrical bis(5'-nucleosyl)-tetraphosphatase [Candidatus Schneideria nysicola]|uniref:symmetrical bis(5'-nucleosyl)-tetraphosphatase n=1 Tax=Candidatus Schneideria nysicola TaxID=1081631 RepID=UPI001CAA563B|nr:symmetrical bis(5'-nucleosyl)-tetraphosphatase [Candidatus Schneideria nysicola]UAJ65561.1 symmetrical bis(5'-nucleosyl)-tetraphosphatase [Candidatus Schneideria nysicola]
MSTYFIGDVHGCYKQLENLLDKVKFNPLMDTIWLTGDLVHKGPNSIEVLSFIHSLGKSTKIVLGNHDIQFIKNNYCSNIDKIRYLVHWLRHQSLIQIDEERKIFMVHAGVIPQWNINNVIQYAHDIELQLRGNNFKNFIKSIYNKKNNTTLNELNFNIQVFTKIRYCFSDGKLDINREYHQKIERKNSYSFLSSPWFNFYGPIRKKYNIIFGHWSALMGRGLPSGIYGLDTGCCWGGYLTMLRWEDKKIFRVSGIKNK